MAAPVVTTSFQALDFSEIVALADLFTFSDADGDPLVSLTITDSGFGTGQFFVNGVPQAEGTPFTVVAADIPTSFYQADGPGFFGLPTAPSGEEYTITAFDGIETSLPSTETIRVGNTAPTILAQPSVVPIGGRIAFTDMFRASDLEQDEFTLFRVRDNNGSATSGSFILDNTVLAPNIWHELTPAEANRLEYQGGNIAGQESFSVTVDDAELRSPVSNANAVTGNTRPVITPLDANVFEGSTANVSDFFNVSDPDGDEIARFFVVDRSSNPASGSLELNGTTLESGVFHSLSPAQFELLQYRGADVGPTFERLGIQVIDDNSAVSPTVDLVVNTTSAPEIFATDRTSVSPGERVNVDQLFNAFDPDGGEIESYFFVDRRINSNGGFFEFRGVRQPSAQFFFVNADELDQVVYVGGSSAGTDVENIGILASDSDGFSNPVNLQIVTNPLPTAIGIDGSILEAFRLDVAPLVSGSDSTGTAAQTFRFTDIRTSPLSGFFELDGVRQPSGSFFDVSAADIDNLEFVGGAFGEQVDPIRLQTIINGVLSDPTFFNLTTLENQFAPTVQAFDVEASVNTSIDFLQMFTFDDADGIPPTEISEVRIFDTGPEADSGFFTINGVRQPARVFISVPFEQILAGEVRYQVSSRADSELFRVTVNDGRFQSVLSTGEIRAIAPPVLEASVNDLSVDTIERVVISDLIQQTDGGPLIESFEVYDSNDDFRSGRLELDGVSLQQGVVHTLTANEFDRLVVLGAEADFGRQIDPILVRGANGIGLDAEWVRINVNTDPIGAASLLSTDIYADDDGDGITQITYSFIDGGTSQASGGSPPLPFYYEPVLPCTAYAEGCEAEQTAPYNQPQREATRELLAGIETFLNIEFQEVPFVDNVNLEHGALAQITFGHWGFEAGGIPGNPAYAIENDGDGLSTSAGDIWTDWQRAGWNPLAGGDNPTSVQGLGTDFNFQLLRVIGNSLGLEFDNTLSIFNNFNFNTILSNNNFNVNSQFNQAFPEDPSTFQLYDFVRLQELYGARTDFNTGNDQYRFNDAHQQTLYDSAGTDTLNLTTQTVDTFLDLRQGQRSTLQDAETGDAFENSLLIPYGVIIENGRTGSGNDTLSGNETRNFLFGNEGSDTLIGRGGNDALRGGDGADTYVWNLGDGRDTIIDFDEDVLANPFNRTEIDRLELSVATGELDVLEEDIIFRRLGNTLRLDLRFDGNSAQGSIVIQDFNLPSNQIETLALFGPSGSGTIEQIGEDIDLVSIFEGATSLSQGFQVTENDGNFGRIAVPI